MNDRPAIHVAGWLLLSASPAFKPQTLPCEPTYRLVNQVSGRTDSNPGRSAKELGQPAGPRAHMAWGLAHLFHVSNTPYGDAHFDIS
jgi:hypothetical protein